MYFGALFGAYRIDLAPGRRRAAAGFLVLKSRRDYGVHFAVMDGEYGQAGKHFVLNGIVGGVRQVGQQHGDGVRRRSYTYQARGGRALSRLSVGPR